MWWRRSSKTEAGADCGWRSRTAGPAFPTWTPRSRMASRPARAWAWGSAARGACRTTSPSSPSPARAPGSPSCVGNRPMISVRVQDQSQVAEARRRASDLAGRHGFNEAEVGKAALVATELATNLIKHSPGGGEILVGTYEEGEAGGLHLLALDQGPGMANV